VDKYSSEQTVRIAPGVNRVYLLQYTYQDRGACALTCFEQRQRAAASNSSAVPKRRSKTEPN